MADPFDYGVTYLASTLGLTPEQARGAVRWMAKVESGLNPTAVNPTSGAYGIAQWLGPRKTSLFRRYGQSPGIEQQFAFVADELRGPEAPALQALRATKTEDEAFRVWGKAFERPSAAEYAKATGGYSSGLRARPRGQPEGYYGGALHVTVRPPGVEFPAQDVFDALLSGDPVPGEDEGDPLAMLDSLMMTEPEVPPSAPAPDEFIEPPGMAGVSPPAAESRIATPIEQQSSLKPIKGLPRVAQAAAPEAPASVGASLLSQLLEQPAVGQAPPTPPPSPAPQAVDVGTGIPISLDRSAPPDTGVLGLPADTMLDKLLSAAGDIGTAIVGVGEQAIAGAENVVRPLGSEIRRTQIPIAPGARAAEGALTFATGGLTSPLTTPMAAARAARPAAQAAGNVSRETSAAMPALMADVRGGVPLRVAARDREGNVYIGRPGQTHADLDLPADFREFNPDGTKAGGRMGFVGPDGKFLSREEAAALAPEASQPGLAGGQPWLEASALNRGGGAGQPPMPPAGGGARPPSTPPVSAAVQSIKDWTGEVVRDLQIKVVPMAARDATDAGRAVAKDYASNERVARWYRSQFDTLLRKLPVQDQRRMWEAMDNASVEAQRVGGEAGLAAGARFIEALPREQQRLLMGMERRGIDLWERARDAGLVAASSERLPFYVPRAILEVSGDDFTRMAAVSRGEGGGLTRGGPMARKYLTAEETEGAAKVISQNAEIVRNIRSLPMAYERFERQIAVKRLVNDLEEIGNATGKPIVAEEKLGPDWFKASERLWVDPAYEGPIRAVIRGQTGAFYNALMAAKGAAMASIMFSPVIHNAVEYGRALGAMPGKVATLKIYGIGARVLRRPKVMEKAIRDGLVPIGERGYMQDIEGIASAADLAPGRGLLAKGLGALTDIGSADVLWPVGKTFVSPNAGEAIRRGIDSAGDLWHQKLLWDQVAKLQAGLYNEFTKDMIKKGIDPDVASKMGAHFANRYAGAIPNETMSEGAKKFLNFALFSRSFTVGNLGVMKDMINGLPRDVQAQVGRALAPLEAQAARSAARRVAIGTVLADIGIMYFSNALLQSGISAMRGDRSLGEEGAAYVERVHELLQRTRESPLDLVNPLHDVELLKSLSPTSENEPGRQERLLVGHRADGAAVYLRSPVGKIGEEFEGWVTKPLEMLKNKEGTIVRPLLNVLNNDRGFGGRVEHVYNRNPHSLGDYAGNAGAILWEFVRSQVPELQLKAAARVLAGKGDATDAAQALAPFAGFTVSKGAPGGEAVGELYQGRSIQDEQVKAALPEVRSLVEEGKLAEATQKLQALGLSPGQIRGLTRGYVNPSTRLSPRALRDFYRYASPEQKRRMEMQMRRQDRGLRPSVGGP